MILDNLFINGGLNLWNRITPHGESREEVVCSRWRQTFLADRWKVRYGQPEGTEIRQRRSERVPEGYAGSYSIELQGQALLGDPVYLGQRIEAGESLRYRRRLRFAARIECGRDGGEFALLVQAPGERDRFGPALKPSVAHELRIPLGNVAAGCWQQVEAEFDALPFGSNGLSVELAVPATALHTEEHRVRICDLKLADATLKTPPTERPYADELRLASRFFCRSWLGCINTPGRAISVASDDLYFQITFPEMRVPPSVVLPPDDGTLRVYGYPYEEVAGFRYEVVHRTCGSIIIKAHKPNHGLTDAYLTFVDWNGSVALDAEL